MRSPTEISDPETYWLRSRDVSDAPAIGGDSYFDRHDVARPEDVTEEDLPPANSEAVRALDREALEREVTVGKWQLTGSAARVEELWPRILSDATVGIVWGAKVMTRTGYRELPYDEYMIVVYTPNYFETHDVFRVREHLREEYGVAHQLYYKPDLYTKNGIVAASAADFGLKRPARYVE